MARVFLDARVRDGRGRPRTRDADRICPCCHRPKEPNSLCCRKCYYDNYEKRREKSTRRCLHCGVSFYRKSRGRKDARHDALLYCSKQCYGAQRTARSIAREIDQSITAEAIRYARPCIECGEPIQNYGRNFFHAACAEKHQREQTLEKRRSRANARPAKSHVCPACGEVFVVRSTKRTRVFCSRGCRRSLRDYRLHLSVLPLEERNELAEMVALLKRARRATNTGYPTTAPPGGG